jgi:peroxiredoxin Q/BCP
MELSVGDPAPDFRAPATGRGGETVLSPADFKGKSSLVLYFYPADDTPGCTREACSFRDLMAEFEKAGSAIVGISPDNQASHSKFAEKHALPFPLIADPDHAIAEAYGAWTEKINYGKRYMGIKRSTFIIDRQGKLAKIWRSVKVDQHADKVLDFVKSL